VYKQTTAFTGLNRCKCHRNQRYDVCFSCS